jgi:hypothetical protein
VPTRTRPGLGPQRLQLLDELAALGEEAPRLLSAGEEERAEPELSAQPSRSDQITLTTASKGSTSTSS